MNLPSLGAIGGIAAMLCTAFATLLMLVMCLAGGANASESEIRMIKLIMLGFSLLSAAGIVAGIFLLRSGHQGWALGSSIAPTLVMTAFLMVGLLR